MKGCSCNVLYFHEKIIAFHVFVFFFLLSQVTQCSKWRCKQQYSDKCHNPASSTGSPRQGKYVCFSIVITQGRQCNVDFCSKKSVFHDLKMQSQKRGTCFVIWQIINCFSSISSLHTHQLPHLQYLGMNWFNLFYSTQSILSLCRDGNWSLQFKETLYNWFKCFSICQLQVWRTGLLECRNKRCPCTTTSSYAGPRSAQTNPAQAATELIHFLYKIFSIVLWMYGVYSSTLYEETILKHCDINRLTVICCQHLFKVDCNTVVVDEVGRCVNIYWNMCVLLDSCLSLIGNMCT